MISAILHFYNFILVIGTILWIALCGELALEEAADLS